MDSHRRRIGKLKAGIGEYLEAFLFADGIA